MTFPNAGFKFRFRQCVHYVSSSIIGKNGKFLKESPAKLMTLLALPFGAALTAMVYFKTRG